MKVLFVALHDPTLMDLASGSDYFHYKAICDNGFDVKVIGPFEPRPGSARTSGGETVSENR